MAPKHDPSTTTYAQPDKLDVKYGRTDAADAIAAFKDLPISLDSKGEFQAELKGKELHIYETKKGITNYKVTDHSRVDDVEMQPGTIIIRCDSGKAEKVVLHSAPAAADPRAISDKDLKALPYLDEFEKLSAKDRLTAAETERKIELVKLIAEAYQDPETEPASATAPKVAKGKGKSGSSTGTSPSTTPKKASSPPTPSGESRGAVSTSGESRGATPTPSSESRYGGGSSTRSSESRYGGRSSG